MARILIIMGLILIVAGLLWPLLSKLGLGQLPGDLYIKHKNFSLYFPITTCIVISIIVTIIIWLLKK